MPPWLRPHQVSCDVPPRIPVTRRPTSLCSRASTCLCGRTVAEPAVTTLTVLSTILVTVPFITSFTVPFFKLLAYNYSLSRKLGFTQIFQTISFNLKSSSRCSAEIVVRVNMEEVFVCSCRMTFPRNVETTLSTQS